MYYDAYTRALIGSAPELPPALQRDLELLIRERKALFDYGVLNVPEHVQDALRAIDPKLRCRWDFWKAKRVIERLIHTDGQWSVHYTPVWEVVADWPEGDDGRPITLLDLLDRLREGDMWRWESPQAYLEHKRAKARAVAAANEKKANDKVAAAVDSLSSRQVSEFLAVERARHTGETLISHGADERFMDRAYEREKRGM